MTRRGFTLIELLVVVAIITALLAVLMPSLRGAKDAARAVVCASQQHSIGLALRLYASDNTDFFPYAYQAFPAENAPWSPVGSSLISWDDLLGGGYDGRSLTRDNMLERWLRPGLPGNAHDSRLHKQYVCPEHNVGSGFHRSYGINGGQWGATNPPVGIASAAASVRSVAVPAADRTIAVGETDTQSLGSNLRGAMVTSPFQQIGMEIPGWGPTAPWHRFRTQWNYLFVDGHVALLDPETTYGTGNRGGPPRDDDGAKGLWTRNPND